MSETLTVRRAAPEEGAAVGRLWLRLLDEQAALEPRFAPAPDALARWQADFADRARDGGRRILVAERGGALVGFATAARWWPAPVYAGPGEVYLDELYVVPEVRRAGIATRLVEAMQAWGEAVGAARLRVGLLTANDDARRFWARRGAEPFAETRTIALAAAAAPDVKDRRIGF